MIDTNKLIRLRKNKKKTQDDVSKILGITRPAYTAYEKGVRNPDYETLGKIADYFEVTTDYLLGRSDYPSMDKEGSDFVNKYGIFESKNEERDFAMDYESWTEEEKEEMREFVRFKMEQRKKKRNK